MELKINTAEQGEWIEVFNSFEAVMRWAKEMVFFKLPLFSLSIHYKRLFNFTGSVCKNTISVLVYIQRVRRPVVQVRGQHMQSRTLIRPFNK